MKRTVRSTSSSCALLLAMVSLLGGCTLGPNYQRPMLDLPDAWRSEDTPPVAVPGTEIANLANLDWWNLFRDPQLQALIRTALKENQDLLLATERIVEARARVSIERSALYPQVALGVSTSRFEQSRESFPNTAPPADRSASLYQVSTDVTWELDLFGRIRRSTEAEKARLLATEEGRRAVVISLVAAVADTYVSLRSADLRLDISRSTLKTREEALDLARIRYRGGLTSELDPQQAEAEYYRVKATMLQLEQLVREQENFLSVLVGHAPGPIKRGSPLPDLPVALEVPAGLPSNLLDRRPDLRVAEEELHATTAGVGAAKALLFPRIALTADIGTVSTEMDAFFAGSSMAWSVAAGAVQPIFQAGRNIRRVEVAKSRMRQSLYAYHQAVLVALREVEDGLIGFEKSGETRAAQHGRVEAGNRVLALAWLRYEGGVTDYLEVLDSQRSLFLAQFDEVDAMRAQVSSLIRLYKALGGGWSAEPEDVPIGGESASTPETGQP